MDIRETKDYETAAARALARRDSRNMARLSSHNSTGFGAEVQQQQEQDQQANAFSAAVREMQKQQYQDSEDEDDEHKYEEKEHGFEDIPMQQQENYTGDDVSYGGDEEVRRDNSYLERSPPSTAKLSNADTIETASSSKKSKSSSNLILIKTTEDKLREAERIIASEVYYVNEVPSSLSKFSMMAFFFQLFQSMFLFFVAGNSDVKWNLTSAYPDPGLNGSGDDNSMYPSLKQVGTVSVLWLAPVVTLLSGVEHFSCVLFRPTYEYYIARHQNPFRWTEYTFSASLLKVIIAIQAGVTDIHLLVCIFVLMALCIQDGATHEAVNAKARSENRPQNWRPYITSYVGWCVGWAIIWNYFIVYNSRGGSNASVWVIMVVLFLLDSSFAVLFHLQWFKIGIFDDYVNGEKAYICLSFTTKSSLVWLSVINSLKMG